MRTRVLTVVALGLASVSPSCARPDLLDVPAATREERRPSPEPASSARPSHDVARRAPSPVPSAPTVPLRSPSLEAVAPEPARAAAAGGPVLPASLPPELLDDGSDEAPEPEPPAPRARPAKAPVAAEELASLAKETWIYSEPRWASRRVGYLRAGAVVARRAEPAGFASCSEGWYRIEPKGYVCVGATATLDPFDPVVEASARRPRRDTLPYAYVMSRFPPPPLYARLPSAEEALRVEPDLKSHLRKAGFAALDPSYVAPPPAEPVPGALLYGQVAPGLASAWRAPSALELGRAHARSGFALLSTFDHDGRRYGLTTELAVLPLDRTRVIRPSSFAGMKLDDEVTLPVAFVRGHHVARLVPGPGGALVPGEPLSFRQAIALREPSRWISGKEYHEAQDGSLVPAEQAVRVDRFHSAPAWVANGRKWIDVSILRQSLVAYEGKRPVYVTLVSTGADGLGDPKKTHSTIQGAFLIHTKHLTVTMDDDKIGDQFDFRDVPFVQYFTEGFALHAAYWHDEFGTPRSHGCVNLAPLDAAWLFNWTDPEVPAAWHAALSLKKGTLVYIHP